MYRLIVFIFSLYVADVYPSSELKNSSRYQEKYESLERLISKGEFEQAIKIIEGSLSNLPSSETKSIHKANLLDFYARALSHSKSKLSEGIKMATEALQIREQIHGKSSLNAVRSLFNLVHLNNALGNHSESIAISKKIITIIEPHSKTRYPELADAYDTQGRALRMIGQLQQSVDVRKKAIEIIKKEEGINSQELIMMRSNLGVSLRKAGHHIEAEKQYLEALRLIKHWNKTDSWTYTSLLVNYGSLLNHLNRYGDALDKLYLALELRERKVGAEHRTLAVINSNIAGILFKLGKYEKALTFNLNALKVFSKSHLNKQHPTLTILTRAVGKNLTALGQYEQALVYLDKGLEIAKKNYGQTSYQYGSMLFEIGKVQAKKKKYQLASDLFNQAEHSLKSVFHDYHPAWINLLLARGKVNLDLGSLEKSSTDQQAASHIINATFTKNSDVNANSLTLAAMIELKKKNYEGSYLLINEAMEIYSYIISINKEINLDSFNVIKAAQQALIHYLEIMEKAAGSSNKKLNEGLTQAFRLSQVINNDDLSYVASMLANRVADRSLQSAKLVKQLQNLYIDRKKYSNLLEKQAKKKKSEKSTTQQTKLIKKIVQIDEEILELKSNCLDCGRISSVKSIDIKTLQSKLTEKEAVFYLDTFSEQSSIWFITKSSMQFHKIEITKKQLHELVQELTNISQQKKLTSLLELPVFNVEKANQLYNLLLKPFEKQLNNVSHIAIAGNNPLINLPMGILVKEVAQNSEPINNFNQYAVYKDINWLAKSHSFSYAPSLHALSTTEKSKNAKLVKSFIGFGHPLLKKDSPKPTLNYRSNNIKVNEIKELPELPHTELELISVASTFEKNNANIYTQAQATETNLKNLDLTRYNYLSFATHSLSPDKVEGLNEAALVLSPPESKTEIDDGLLTTSEISQLNLTSDLVVLSACSTGVSAQSSASETLESLAHSFIFAGAKSLLISHWDIESVSTEIIVTEMFNNLEISYNKAQALQLSQINMIKNGKPYQSHPLFWGAFSIVGDHVITGR